MDEPAALCWPPKTGVNQIVNHHAPLCVPAAANHFAVPHPHSEPGEVQQRASNLLGHETIGQVAIAVAEGGNV